jgi:hypothetical protein
MAGQESLDERVNKLDPDLRRDLHQWAADRELEFKRREQELSERLAALEHRQVVVPGRLGARCVAFTCFRDFGGPHHHFPLKLQCDTWIYGFFNAWSSTSRKPHHTAATATASATPRNPTWRYTTWTITGYWCSSGRFCNFEQRGCRHSRGWYSKGCVRVVKSSSSQGNKEEGGADSSTICAAYQCSPRRCRSFEGMSSYHRFHRFFQNAIADSLIGDGSPPASCHVGPSHCR